LLLYQKGKATLQHVVLVSHILHRYRLKLDFCLLASTPF